MKKALTIIRDVVMLPVALLIFVWEWIDDFTRPTDWYEYNDVFNGVFKILTTLLYIALIALVISLFV